MDISTQCIINRHFNLYNSNEDLSNLIKNINQKIETTYKELIKNKLIEDSSKRLELQKFEKDRASLKIKRASIIQLLGTYGSQGLFDIMSHFHLIFR